MATQAPAAAFGPGARRIEAWEAIDALPCSTGNSATPGNEFCPRLEFPQFTATPVPGATRSRQRE
jgi:hypothetical protein